MTFTYEEFTTRNIGFVTAEEQKRICRASVFICGTGGMGGAAIQSLVRAGVGRLFLADIDEFEISNFNRQVFANLESVDQQKAEATRAQCLKINPNAKIEIFNGNWTEFSSDIVSEADVVVNGTDDLGASVLLYRLSRSLGKPIVDAYSSPLPSVFVTRAGRPMPEERLGYPTIGTDWDKFTDDQRQNAFLAEALYVMMNSSSRHHIDLNLAGEVASGLRSRMSFAPMVINTGTLMAYEVLGLLLNKSTCTDERGWFFNPYRARVEKPLPGPFSTLLKPFVARQLQKLINRK
ncbi:ThiF family adenylyltransferase [uncultured Roseibium sp.]|uniref:ThiF family adenylyltransferase n=1 Tax=uncultured Roseibium sp. TaxID=1936171 RepID=UPI002610CA8A|nr:ThiF family adenylyltransferase [uncultured Roseibium sp.]